MDKEVSDLRQQLFAKRDRLLGEIKAAFDDAIPDDITDLFSHEDWDELYRGLEWDAFFCIKDGEAMIEITWSDGRDDRRYIPISTLTRFTVQCCSGPRSYFDTLADALEEAALVLRNPEHVLAECPLSSQQSTPPRT